MTNYTPEDIQAMRNEAIAKAIRWRMTHCETYTWKGEPLDGTDKPKGEYVLSFEPRHPNGLLPNSAAHQEKMIDEATAAAIRAMMEK